VGLSPKRMARILRLQRALAASARERDLTSTALDAGYADHSHFVNECRALSGLSPRTLLT
jgi:AraC-like DNA-binding protein